LQAQGCTQFFFKYCSTFDSTPLGNIGPVAEALANALNADRVIFCPAFPGTGRSVYQGHLFVNDMLLNESGMQDHPLTPMTDADLRRCLSRQTNESVGHINAQTVFAGAPEIVKALNAARVQNQRFLVVDAIRDEDLIQIGRAAEGLALVTGGSGVAMGLPANFGCRAGPVPWDGQPGTAMALSGSCSIATRGQVAMHAIDKPAKEISAKAVIENDLKASEVLDWALEQGDLPLIYSSTDPDAVRAVQKEFGRERSATAIENFFSELAQLAVSAGVTRIITAGGETSGAVVEGLGLDTLTIGPEIDPGVPALRARPDLVLALKSGNFGAEDFFEKANRVLQG
jgi:uncharacterized protein YgbK (DUF1537 family)